MLARNAVWIALLTVGLVLGVVAIYVLCLHRAGRSVSTADVFGEVAVAFSHELDQGSTNSEAAPQHGSVLNSEILVTSDEAARVAEEAFRKEHGVLPTDYWGRRISIKATSKFEGRCTLSMTSAGADGVFGTNDDITFDYTFDMNSRPEKSALGDLQTSQTTSLHAEAQH